MSFFDNFLNKFLFSLTYILIGIEIYAIYLIEDSSDSYVDYYKYVFYFFTLMTILSHLATSFTNPGKITHSNNITYIDFYFQSRLYGIQRAEKFNEKPLLKPPIDPDDSEDLSDIEDDELEYPDSEMRNQDIEVIKNKFGINITKCEKCKVYRVSGARHCSSCHGCIYGIDHHCPWTNNCIGQFNLKYFILFNFYAALGCCLATMLTGYYVLYKNPGLYL